MRFGGITTNNNARAIMRLSAIAIPVVLTLYGILIQQNIITSAYYVSDIFFVILMLSWLTFGVLQYVLYTNNGLNVGLRLTLYHVFAILYILFVSGFSVPFIAFWILLLLASYAYFSYKGVLLSLLLFVGIATVDMFRTDDSVEFVVMDFMAVFGVIIVGLTAIALTKVQETNSEQLKKSKKDELLQRDSILTLVNNLADPILSTDSSGKISIFNASVLGLLDTNESLIGKNISEVVTLYDEDKNLIDFLKLLRNAQSVIINDSLTMKIAEEE